MDSNSLGKKMGDAFKGLTIAVCVLLVVVLGLAGLLIWAVL